MVDGAARTSNLESASSAGTMSDIGWWGLGGAVLGGAIRAGTPFLFVSLGECLTEPLRPDQSRPRRHAHHRRDDGLRCLLPHRLAPGSGCSPPQARRRRCSARSMPASAACGASTTSRSASRLMVFGTGLAFFPWQAADPAARRDAAVARSLRPLRAAAACAPRSTSARCFLVGVALAFALRWGLVNTRAGMVLAHRRRQRGGGARHGPLGAAGPARRDHGWRFSSLESAGRSFRSPIRARGARASPAGRA